MERRLFGFFSSWQVTAIVALAIIAPSAVYGVAAYQNVAIEDVTSGARVRIDPTGRMEVVEAASLPTRNPINLVKIIAHCTPPTSGHTIYTVPSGKSLVVTNARMALYGGSAGENFIYLGDTDTTFIAGFDTLSSAQGFSSTLNFYEKISLSMYCSSNSLANIDGYLVPASVVPSGAQINEQDVRSGPPLYKHGLRL